jgi:hypothetical protein
MEDTKTTKEENVVVTRYHGQWQVSGIFNLMTAHSVMAKHTSRIQLPGMSQGPLDYVRRTAPKAERWTRSIFPCGYNKWL